MNQRTIMTLFWGVLLCHFTTSCNKEENLTYPEDKKTSDYLDFYIDSIYNITETSATIKATVTGESYPNLVVSHLSVKIGRTKDIYEDSLYREELFSQKEGTVVKIVSNLKPKTTYYVAPWINFESDSDRYTANITSISSAFSQTSFTTK